MISPIRRILDRRRTQKPVDEAETLRQALKRRQAIVERILAFAPLLRTLLVLAGLLYTLALPHKSLGRGHYVDENALQPGQVNTYWNWADVHVADRYADNVATWSELSPDRRSRAIKEAFQELGLPAVQQPYRFDLSSTSNVSGINTYAILAAPKTDGTEALVIGASWLSRATDEAGERRINVRGVALLLAIANYFKKYSMWSKDIIFVVADGYIDGMQAWLDAYHGNGQSKRLPLTTGPIWAAINLDYPHHSFSHIGLYFEGANGHLPNMDLINSASRILHHTGIQPLLHTYNSHDDQHPLIKSVSEALPQVVRSEVKTYLHGAANLFRQVALGADSRVLGPEGSFGRYRIDAIALFGVPAEGPHGFHALGRATESLVRSLNNLLERLHASVFLYLMTSVDTFISVSNYLAAPILIGAGLTIDGLITWSQASASANNKSGVAKEKPVLLAMILLGVAALVGSLEVALIARLDPHQRLPEYLSAGLLSLHLFTPLLVVNILKSPTMASLTAPQRGVSSTSLSTTLRAVVLLASGLLISITATLNFGWSLFAAVYLAVVAFLIPPLYRRYSLRRQTFRRRMQQFALALASPAGLWTVWRIGRREAAETWLQELLRDWHVGGGWGLPVAVGLVGPLVLLQAVSVQL
ncbi:Glycosyl phosphatidyl inositol protein transamidase complex subunit [Rhodotorula mucilaginosa]|uniref:Glycosyl phosphatidyl inositol protein transamidase complex subunit n=1 Tax=Rhodotorula mucilaginosa TaxID=5537 RepID=A0A9P6W6W2_RHOMI|nr:Glycosyl phosphatidyl inositol protein transamidase complex subunit [Rhodotorula mucilaginosa]